ncbi:MAG TPA: 3'-5' exonuclease, partial [candidate division Zixibacteria bacterium]|nr:3'-5' exonuclease [candidate division Zixibacteria bacterium]
MGIFGQKEVVAFDFETTGVDPGFDRIIEIGAVKVFDDGRQETFKRLVNPQRQVPFYVKQLTGIDDSMLSEAEPI